MATSAMMLSGVSAGPRIISMCHGTMPGTLCSFRSVVSTTAWEKFV